MTLNTKYKQISTKLTEIFLLALMLTILFHSAIAYFLKPGGRFIACFRGASVILWQAGLGVAKGVWECWRAVIRGAGLITDVMRSLQHRSVRIQSERRVASPRQRRLRFDVLKVMVHRVSATRRRTHSGRATLLPWIQLSIRDRLIVGEKVDVWLVHLQPIKTGFSSCTQIGWCGNWGGSLFRTEERFSVLQHRTFQASLEDLMNKDAGRSCWILKWMRWGWGWGLSMCVSLTRGCVCVPARVISVLVGSDSLHACRIWW